MVARVQLPLVHQVPLTKMLVHLAVEQITTQEQLMAVVNQQQVPIVFPSDQAPALLKALVQLKLIIIQISGAKNGKVQCKRMKCFPVLVEVKLLPQL